jgi:hypothetical protein
VAPADHQDGNCQGAGVTWWMTALGRILPILLASERGAIEVGPQAAQHLVAASVDEVGAEDPIIIVPNS